MMKKVIFTFLMLSAALAGRAQISDGVSATLQAGETTTVFYGYDAFKDAVAAAPSDAVSTITLSPGAFNNPGAISKSIKVYGAGFLPDVVNNISDTRVIGDFYITSKADFTPEVRLEGIYFTAHFIMNGKQTISNTEIVKCSFDSFWNRVETYNTIIRQSYIRGGVYGESYKSTAFRVANSFINWRIEGFGAGSQVSFDHCILAMNADWNLGPYYYTNNIVAQNYYGILDGATCYNNVGYESKFSNGGKNISVGNYDVTQWVDWKTLLADGQNDLKFYLTDTTTPRTWFLADDDGDITTPYTGIYKGTDGTPCGVTGGDFPWNPIPATPRILSTSVDAKSEAGKLKVSIKAEARPLE